jgi:hypothetical protein
MAEIVNALRKVPLFLVDHNSGRSVSGVMLRLDGALEDGVLIPLALLRSDNVGYASFRLNAWPNGISIVHLWLTALGTSTAAIDLLQQFREDVTSGKTSVITSAICKTAQTLKRSKRKFRSTKSGGYRRRGK